MIRTWCSQKAWELFLPHVLPMLWWQEELLWELELSRVEPAEIKKRCVSLHVLVQPLPSFILPSFESGEVSKPGL